MNVIAEIIEKTSEAQIADRIVCYSQRVHDEQQQFVVVDIFAPADRLPQSVEAIYIKTD